MTKLARLHARLLELRRRRRGIRLGVGYVALAVAVLWSLLAVFLIDWLLEMNRPQRIVSLVIWAVAVFWAFRRFTLPWLKGRESELEMALMVQRAEHIDSDLVAALQFEQPEAPEWGSVQLEDAVIDHTAEISPRLDVMKGLSRRQLFARTATLAVTAALLVVGIWWFPDYAATFLNRLLLGVRHYPTDTVIETVKINRRQVDLTARRRVDLKSPYGLPARFEVTCSGRLPLSGRARLKTLRGGLKTNVLLESTKDKPNVYVGELPRLVDSISYQFYLGDAWTERGRLLVVPLPMIDVRWEVTPPDYASEGRASLRPAAGLRQISVIEGSRLTPEVRSDKPLREATLTIDEQLYRLSRCAAGRETDGLECWTLGSKYKNTPLDAVVAPLRYAIQVTDMDQLQLERPIQGVIRIKPDQRPRIQGSIVTHYVLPAARPTVAYEASDDYGLARIAVVREVIHEDGQTETDEVDYYRFTPQTAPDREKKPPRDRSPKTVMQGRLSLALARLGLVKGDQLKITLRAVDYRGPREGKSALSEPMVFHVTDERGILKVLSEMDRQSAEQLKTMIQRQIDVGGEPQ